MPTSVDELQIELNAKATSANDAIDKLIGKLDKLSTSLGKLNGSGINGVANGIDKLGKSMQTINSINSKSFTRLADNIQKLGNINVYNLNSSASALSNITRAFNQLGGVTQSAQQVGNLAGNLSKLGNKTVVNATQNIPQLANSLNYLMKVLSKAPVVSQNVISLVNSLSNLTSQGAKVGSSSNSIVRGLNNVGKTSEKTSKKVFSLASAFGSLYANFFWVIRGIKGVWKSIGETTDYIESFNYYTVAFDKIASEWDDKYESYGTENAKKYTNAFVTQMSDSFSKLSGLKLDLSDDLESGILSDTGMKNLGLNLREVTQYASQLASVTNSVGQTGQVSLMTADAFTKLAGDMSSLFNVDFSTVANNLQSGLIGQSRVLYKHGIDITNATLQTYAYKMGLEKAVSEMTQMEKMQLRMIAILDQSKVSWGDLANTIESPSNMIRQLSNNFKEASMVLGQLFLPLLNKVLPVINGVVIAIKNLLVSMASFAGIDIPLDDFGGGVSESTDDLLDFQEGMDEATSSAKKLKNQLQGFDKLNNLTTANASNVNGAIGGTIDLSSQIQKSTEEYQKAWNEAYANMENKAQEFAKNIEKALSPIKRIFENLVIGDVFVVGQDVGRLVVDINNFLSRAIENVDWDKVGTDFGNFLKGIPWKDVLNSFGELFWNAIEAVIEIWASSFSAAPIETGIFTAIMALKFTGLGSLLANKITSGIALDFTTAFGTLSGLLASFQFGTPLDLVGVNILGAIEDGLEIILPEWAEDMLGNIVAGLSVGAVSGSWIPGLGTFAGAVIGGIIGALKSVKIDGQSLLSIYIEKLFNFDMANSWLEEAKKSFKRAFDGQRTDWLDMGGYLIEGIVEGFLAALTYVTEPFTDLFWWFWDGICDVFGIHSPAKEMKPLGNYILLGIVDGFEGSFSKFTTSISNFWNRYIMPWFSREKWETLSNGMKIGVQTKWNELKAWWENNRTLSNIKTNVESFLNKVKDAWNEAKEWWKSNAKFEEITAKIKLPRLTIKWETDTSAGKLLQKLGLKGFPDFSVSYYKDGGFPEDGWFRASKGEYFGSFDDGTSVIANNNQIISGISNGVKSANAEQNALLREQNALLRQILAKDTGISTRDIFNAVRSENRDYINRNGESAFAY